MWDVDFAKDSSLLASASEDGALAVWNCKAKDGEKPFVKKGK